ARQDPASVTVSGPETRQRLRRQNRPHARARPRRQSRRDSRRLAARDTQRDTASIKQTVFNGVSIMGTPTDRSSHVAAHTTRALPTERLSLAQRKQMWPYIFVALPFLDFMFVNFSAILSSFLFSFEDYVTNRAERYFIGLDNYTNVVSKPSFHAALRYT